MDKQQARIYGKSARNALPVSLRDTYSDIISKRVIEIISSYDVIGCYISMKSEVKTDRIISWCLSHNKRIAVPIMFGNTLEFYEIGKDTIFETACFGVSEPTNGNKIDISSIACMIVPLTAFDSDMHRAGYGKGYYDSVLNSNMHKIGIAFSCQEVDSIKTDEWDVSMDEIITEK